MSFEVQALPEFERTFKKLVRKFPSLRQEFVQLVHSLTVNPEQGTALGNNCYKIRLAIASKGKGKSGGARVITCVKVERERVYLLAIFDKSDQANISDKELRALAASITASGI